jgi:arylsulfatase A-like enzyme
MTSVYAENDRKKKGDFMGSGRNTLAQLFVASLALAVAACPAGIDRQSHPNILLITLDTTRADRLGCYGYARDTTPNLDALADESIVYTDARSTSSWTLPAHASLFTAKFPTAHGALYDPQGPLLLTSAIEGPESWDRYRARGLSPDETTLAHLLRDRGYRTGAIVGGPWMKRVFGLDAGFDDYDDDQIDTVVGRLAVDVTDRAIEWVARNRERPQFLFLNYYDPHAPYTPPEPFGSRFADDDLRATGGRDPESIGAMYDGEIAYMDHHLGRLLDEIRELGLWDDTWIIVTADHGELLGERERFGHGHYLTEPELRIPLIVKYPGSSAGRTDVAAPVQLTEILPMIATRLDLPVPVDVQGDSPDDVEHPIAAEVYPLPFIAPDGDWRAIYRGPFKFLWNSQGEHELFDLEADPGEALNLIDENPGKAEELRSALGEFFDGLPRPPEWQAEETPVDPETIEALKGLGYVN